MRSGKNVRRLCHKVYAAEDDKFRERSLRRHPRELERIPRQIRVTDYVIALEMMAQNDKALAKVTARRLDALAQLGIRHPEVIFERGRLFHLHNSGHLLAS